MIKVGLKSGFCKIAGLVMAAAMVVGDVFAAQQPNPRESVQKVSGRAGAASVNVSRRARNDSAQPVRSGTDRAAAIAMTRVVRSGARAIPSPTNTRNGAMTRVFSRAAGVSRAALPTKSVARAGKNSVSSTGGIARSALARATAIFNDVSKIGSGYASCRESYATCMDQMCAAANDTYRRCFCSERFTKFRDTENAMDQAMAMLRQFEDNNLNAVDKSAAEVSAMYSATVGEKAIKNDTSAAAQVLNSIGDLLSGKKPASSNDSTGIIDFSVDLDDVWGNNNSSSLFASKQEKDLSQMEGAELFASAQQQCVRLSQSQCENDAVFNMAKSSYNILISQDCNLYEKTVNKKKANVEDAVRQAEKMLRDARLEEYRSHNSADVNECIDKVRTGMQQESACGEDYKRCLDPTGSYISASTGDPIYSQKLLKLTDLIDLGMDMNKDVLAANQTYNNYLDGYRQRVAKELDTCRDNAEYVWTEFKRAAIIEIAQAQEAKVEEVKAECVNIIAECYNTTTGQLNSFDTTDSKAAGAIGRYAAKGMCKDKVNACAALYGDGKCNFDANGKITNLGNGADKKGCGLAGLLAFVDTVDSEKVSELCEAGMENYLKEICTPASGNEDYPWSCRTRALGVYNSGTPKSGINADLGDLLSTFASQNCKDPETGNIDTRVQTKVTKALTDIKDELQATLAEKCIELGGYWLNDQKSWPQDNGVDEKEWIGYYSDVFGAGGADIKKMPDDNGKYNLYGVCIRNSAKSQCEAFNATAELVKYNPGNKDCTPISDAWYESRACKIIDGFYEDGVCYRQKQ